MRVNAACNAAIIAAWQFDILSRRRFRATWHCRGMVFDEFECQTLWGRAPESDENRHRVRWSPLPRIIHISDRSHEKQKPEKIASEHDTAKESMYFMRKFLFSTWKRTEIHVESGDCHIAWRRIAFVSWMCGVDWLDNRRRTDVSHLWVTKITIKWKRDKRRDVRVLFSSTFCSRFNLFAFRLAYIFPSSISVRSQCEACGNMSLISWLLRIRFGLRLCELHSLHVTRAIVRDGARQRSPTCDVLISRSDARPWCETMTPSIACYRTLGTNHAPTIVHKPAYVLSERRKFRMPITKTIDNNVNYYC